MSMVYGCLCVVMDKIMNKVRRCSVLVGPFLGCWVARGMVRKSCASEYQLLRTCLKLSAIAGQDLLGGKVLWAPEKGLQVFLLSLGH